MNQARDFLVTTNAQAIADITIPLYAKIERLGQENAKLREALRAMLAAFPPKQEG